MKKNKALLKIISLLFCIVFLSSCGSKEMLKTKDVTDRITQTKVILQSENNENEEFEEFFKEFSPSFTLPGLFEGVIPQGICYNALLDSYIISNYYEDGAFPSVITIVNAESGKFEKALFLQYDDGTDYTGHAGGIACSDEYIFISSDGQCYTISIEAIIKAENYDKLQFESNFKLNTKGSFAAFSDDVLWFGDFIESDTINLFVFTFIQFQGVQQMPGNSFSFAVRVGCEKDLVCALCTLADLFDEIALAANVDIVCFKVIFNIHAQRAFGKIAHVTDGCDYLVVGSEIALYGECLGGRLEYDQISCHSVFVPFVWFGSVYFFVYSLSKSNYAFL